MDDREAADYAETLSQLCKDLILKADHKRWTRTDTFIDRFANPFASGKQIAQHLESANLAECQQGRMGNRFDCLLIRLNERGAYLKEFMLQTKTDAGI